MIRSSILDPEYHILFPYETFPWRLEVNKDCHNVKGIALTVCHFECEEHLANVQQTTRKSSNGGASAVRKRKSSVDSTRDTSGNSKRKK
jgi:hypothetical protein